MMSAASQIGTDVVRRIVLARMCMDTAGESPAADPAAPSFATRWAVTRSDVRAAQRLRFQVFAGEMGAQLPSSPSRAGRP